MIKAPAVAVFNNIIEVTAADSGGYLSGNSTLALVSGSNNLCFGAGPCPGVFGARSVNKDPRFVNTSGPLPAMDFHLLRGSSAIGAAKSSPSPATDHDGVIRASPSALGAYEAAPARWQGTASAAGKHSLLLEVHALPIGIARQQL